MKVCKEVCKCNEGDVVCKRKCNEGDVVSKCEKVNTMKDM